jgi:predicted DNA-binding transcriptional regulator AlpA
MQQETNPIITVKNPTSVVEFNPPKNHDNLGFLRIWQIIGDPKAEPPISALIPISRTSWLNGVKSGKYPKHVQLGARMTAWRVQDIQDLINSINQS